MDAINLNSIEKRIAYVWDTMAGAQLMHKGIKEYTGALGKAVGLVDKSKGNEADFLRDYGGGIG